MKTKHYAMIALLATACAKPVDKKAELADLKGQYKSIEAKIKVLEKEIGVTKVADDKTVNVTVSPLAAQDFKHFVEAQGLVEAKNNVMVPARSQGTLLGVYVTEGSGVKAGQVIAEQDNGVLRESIEAMKTQLDLAAIIYEKQKTLWDQKIGTEIQFLQAKATKESLERNIATQQKQLAMSKIIAPIAGVVDEVKMKIGEMPIPGMSYIRIVNLNNLKVKANISDIYLATVRLGDYVLVKFPDLNKEINAKVSFVSRVVNPASRTFSIEVSVPNVGGLLKPNQIAVVNINDQSTGRALVIPQNLIQESNGQSTVLVARVEGNKKIARSRKITTGLQYNGQIEIKTGLQSGDLIITQGYQELVDGQTIAY
jgi:RND family efflux transporter MFP subunit